MQAAEVRVCETGWKQTEWAPNSSSIQPPYIMAQHSVRMVGDARNKNGHETS